MAATLYVMQGVPGSGKSTLAEIIRKSYDYLGNCYICSTDDYFYLNGKYDFRPEMLEAYHKMNLDTAKRIMAAGYSAIIDNTNILRKHVKPYVEYAISLNIPVVFIRVTGDFKSIHGVPKHAIERMKAQMEDLTLESVLNCE